MPATGTFVYSEDVSVSAAARTATGSTSAVRVGGLHTVRAFLDVTAVSGTTPTMTVTLETSHDSATGWQPVASFAARTAVGAERKAFGPLNEFIRWTWTVGGTAPSFTFSCSARMVG